MCWTWSKGLLEGERDVVSGGRTRESSDVLRDGGGGAASRSLRAALTYSIGVLALRNPFLHKLLDYEDESFSLLMLVLEAHSLRTTDASFSESLYGLRRRPSNIKLNNNDATTSTGSQLHRRQKLLSLLFLVPKSLTLIHLSHELLFGNTIHI